MKGGRILKIMKFSINSKLSSYIDHDSKHLHIRLNKSESEDLYENVFLGEEVFF